MIPYGLLSGIVDGQEVRITQLGENGFVFRMANQAEKIHEIWLQFFSQNGGCYKKLLIPADRMKKMEESRFFTEYTVLTEDKDYQKYTLIMFWFLPCFLFLLLNMPSGISDPMTRVNSPIYTSCSK